MDIIPRNTGTNRNGMIFENATSQKERKKRGRSKSWVNWVRGGAQANYRERGRLMEGRAERDFAPSHAIHVLG